MSKIEELIQQFCPDGVEFKELGKVCLSVTAGGDLPEKYKKGQVLPTNEYPYPIYSNGCDGNGLYGFTDKYKIGSDAVTISARGTIGYHTVREPKFTPIVRLITLIPNKEIVVTKFLNYVLDITPIGGTSGGIPQLTVPNVKKIKIPIPPLPIQQEIVTILDKFTQLQAELQMELEVRSTQYEYYRSMLLESEERKGNVEWTDLQTLAYYSKDRIPAINVNSENYVGVDNLLQNRKGKTLSNFVPTTGNLIKYKINDLLIGNIRPYLKKIWLATSSGGTNGDVLVIRLNAENKNKVNPSFLYFLLSSDKFFDYNTQYSKGGKMPRGDKSAIMRYKIPIPPLAEQDRIVSILKKFDKLINDSSEGIPSEIEARRKQYEYYRGKLLDFKSIING
jgi:type I restriction enzyme S subunit